MNKKYILDNMTGQEIKELMVIGKIKLQDLDTPALEKLFDHETELLCADLEKGDMELIHACAARLDELNGPLMTEEEFFAVINKTIDSRVSVEPENLSAAENVAVSARTNRKKIVWKRIWLTAATIALLAVMVVVPAAALEFNIFEYFGVGTDMFPGERVDKGNATLIYNGKAWIYSSVEELRAEESLDIKYPSLLPYGVSVEKIVVSKNENGGKLVQFVMTDRTTGVSVSTNIDASKITKSTEQMLIGDQTYHIFCDGEFYAVSFYNDCYYFMRSDSYENLILIINNMREIK